MTPYYQNKRLTLYNGDCRQVLNSLDDRSAHMCVTSPPYYGKRDYDADGQIGQERTVAAYIENLVNVFGCLWTVLRNDATLWVVIGDSRDAAGVLGVPWRFALEMVESGWTLRQDIIWAKGNPLPENVTDRCVTAHEYIFLFTKSKRYHFDHKTIAEPATYAGQRRGGSTKRYDQAKSGMDSKMYDTRNKRSVWTVNIEPHPKEFGVKHFATYPAALITPCIVAGCPLGGTIIDPFFGAGTTGIVSARQKCRCIGIELNRDYCDLAVKRINADAENLA